MTRKPLHVAVVSHHQLVRAGLAALLGRHPDRASVVDVSSQDGHLGGQDVAVYDLSALLEGSDDDLRHLLGSRIPVVALVPHERPDLGEGALVTGVAEVVPMDVTATRLLQALERAASHQSPSAAQRSDERRQYLSAQHGLSDREAEILLLIATGLANHEIAQQLFLSINSIKSYIRSAYGKIGVTTRAQAVLWAVQHDPTRIRGAEQA